MATDVLPTASSNPILASCAEPTRDALLAAGEVREFHPGFLLIEDGAPAGVALFPLSGSLQMSKATRRGRRQIFCNPGAHSCGGICLLALSERAVAEVRGATRGTLLVVPRSALLPLTHRDPVLCQASWHSASSCMAHLSDLVAQLSFNTVAERVAVALVSGTQADGDLVRLTQSALAAEVGTTREVVARCLAGFQAEGVIRLGRGRITVLDRERLRSQHQYDTA